MYVIYGRILPQHKFWLCVKNSGCLGIWIKCLPGNVQPCGNPIEIRYIRVQIHKWNPIKLILSVVCNREHFLYLDYTSLRKKISWWFVYSRVFWKLMGQYYNSSELVYREVILLSNSVILKNLCKSGHTLVRKRTAGNVIKRPPKPVDLGSRKYASRSLFEKPCNKRQFIRCMIEFLTISQKWGFYQDS